VEQQPNFSSSNVCMPSHTHRTSSNGLLKKQYAAQGTTGTFLFYSSNPVGQHDYQIAGVVANTDGYSFTSAQGYQDRMRHTRIGVNNYNGTGTSGPCVGCHMTTDGKTHNLKAVTKDAEGVNSNITGITSSICAKCHPSNFTYQDVDAKKKEFNAAVRALAATMVKSDLATWNAAGTGITIRVMKDTSRIAAQAGKAGYSAEKNAGVVYNYQLFSGNTADPGGYVHNPALARRLVFDSIDYLDDGIMNNSSAQTMQALGASSTARAFYNSTTAGKAAWYTTESGCLGCHLGTSVNSNDAPGVEKMPHYNTDGTLNKAGTATASQYVVPTTQCNYCHGFGHGTDSPRYSFDASATYGYTPTGKSAFPNISTAQRDVNANYGENGHADTGAEAWSHYDFKTRNACAACHTTQGFVNAITTMSGGGFTVAGTNAMGSASNTSKQVLGCNACHSSTTWKTSVRTMSGGFVAGMGGYGTAAKATINYPNAGESNVCVPCHASRENGASLKAGNYNFTNKTFVNPHYLAAAAVFYGKGGFRYYTSAAQTDLAPSGYPYPAYTSEDGVVADGTVVTSQPAGTVLTGRTNNWNHGRLGMGNYTTAMLNANNVGKVRGSGNKGQCVACHLGPANNHEFDAYEVAEATWGTADLSKSKGCYGCHSTEDMKEVAEFEERPLVDRALDFATWQAEQLGMYFNNAVNPYWFTNSSYTTSITNWTTQVAGGTGEKTMGAAMNIKLFVAEKGIHVHNRTYLKQMLFDTIMYLQKGDVTYSNRYVAGTGVADVNSLISFSAYSTAKPTWTSSNGVLVSITQLKGWLARKNTSGVNNGLWTRP
jgi:uncharacterized protein YoxC